MGGAADRDTDSTGVAGIGTGVDRTAVSAAPGSGARDANTLHRIDEAFEVNEIKRAGFKLEAASSVLRNPKDDRTWFIMKHRGEQDRFVLKFVKPRGAAGIGGGLRH
jgi:hypothetical protein